MSGSARCTTATFAGCFDHGADQRQLGLMAAPVIMYAGKRPITVTRLRITDVGRQALAGK
jgi:hypothetical protein